MRDRKIEADIWGALGDIGRVEPMAFLLRKGARGKHLDSFRLRPLGDKSRLHAKLRHKITNRLERLEGKERPIGDFDRDYYGDVTIMDVKKNSSVNETIKAIFEMSDSNPIGSLESMRMARYSAVLFPMPDKSSVIAMDTVAVYHEAFSKVGHLISYDDDISDVDGMILFKFGLPCIYFEKLEKLLVLDRAATENMFNLIEHYQGRIEECFERLSGEGRIDVDPGDLKEWTKTNTMARRVNAMIRAGLFDQDVHVYEKYRDYLDSHPEIDDDGLRLRVENGRISIPDKVHFNSFLNFAERNLQQSVIDSDDIYVASRKRRVEKRGR